MTEMDPEKLLRIAQGLEEIELTDEQVNAKARERWTVLPEDRKERILHRRKMREAMFKILKYEARDMPHMMTPELNALKEIFDEQLDPNLAMVWARFTFTWDVHPTGNPVIVRKEAWVREGGGFDPDIGVHFPSAFTEQEID
jgi:hypothetical protein